MQGRLLLARSSPFSTFFVPSQLHPLPLHSIYTSIQICCCASKLCKAPTDAPKPLSVSLAGPLGAEEYGGRWWYRCAVGGCCCCCCPKKVPVAGGSATARGDLDLVTDNAAKEAFSSLPYLTLQSSPFSSGFILRLVIDNFTGKVTATV